jgi:anti-anti-sigma factor
MLGQNTTYQRSVVEVTVAAPSVSIRYHKHTTRIALRGAIAEDETVRLRGLLVDVFLRRRPRRLVVDVGPVTTLDAAALGALIVAADMAPDHAVDFQLQCRDQRMAAEFEQAGLIPSHPPSSPGRSG